MLEAIPDYRKLVKLKLLIKNDDVLLNECGFSKSDNNRLNSECKNVLMEQNEDT